MSNEHNPTDNNDNNDPVDTGSASMPPAPTATLPRPPAPMPQVARPNYAMRIVGVLAVAAVGAIATVVVSILLVMAVAVGAVIGIAAEVDVEQIEHTPTSLEEVPTNIASEQAEVVIDLSGLSAADFENRSEPLDLDIEVDFGSIEIIVPEGVSVDVNAESEVGAVEVFDQSNDGFDNKIVHDGGTNPDLDVNIDLEFGDIRVEQS